MTEAMTMKTDMTHSLCQEADLWNEAANSNSFTSVVKIRGKRYLCDADSNTSVFL
jgi:hypothetical protein